MNAKIRKQLRCRKRRMQRRIRKNNWSGRSPMIDPAGIAYEMAERQQAIASGGIGAILELAKNLGLRDEINRSIPLLKVHLPYDEADHVLNMALNLLAGGTCLDHLEDRRTDEAFLNAVGAERIPDPTTAGDFCRRFSEQDVLMLLTVFNRVREKVWREQPPKFFDQAIIEADGTMVQTCGETKQGIGMNYKKQWGYHPLIITLANTCEPLFIVNRSGNRPSHEHAPAFFDLAITRCRQAGFRSVLLRGDTDFSLTGNFDRWDEEEVEFVFGIDAMPNLVEIAENLEEAQWKTLRRCPESTTPRARHRARAPRYKEQIVIANGYLNKRLKGEKIAQFDYQPGKCSRSYRIVVVRKDIEVTQAQLQLFDKDEDKYFFYVTNISPGKKTARQIVAEANNRCDQENHIAQLKQCALTAPVDNLVSNWAYMVIASLAWNLKVWCGLMIRPTGNHQQRAEQEATRKAIVRMDFTTFAHRILMIPAQIIRSGRRLIYRLLSYRDSVDTLLLIASNVCRPLRC